jgi:hypothetical protein
VSWCFLFIHTSEGLHSPVSELFFVWTISVFCVSAHHPPLSLVHGESGRALLNWTELFPALLPLLLAQGPPGLKLCFSHQGILIMEVLLLMLDS